MTNDRQVPGHVIAVRYAVFAAIAVLLNLTTQMGAFSAIDGRSALPVALVAGSIVGIVAKYLLDKRWIFFDADKRLRQNGVKFAKYTFFGIFTTAIFWSTEIAFELVFETPTMRYLGAVIGLTIGYFSKYKLDQRYVFNVHGGTS